MPRINAVWIGLTLGAGFVGLTVVGAQQPGLPFGPPPSAPPTSTPGTLLGPQGGGEQELLFEAAETAARVGDQYIFQGDLLGDVNLIMALQTGANVSEMTRDQRRVLDLQRPLFMQQMLEGAIDRKLMYVEFLRSIPSEKMEEALANIDSKVGENFTERLFETLEKVQSTPLEEHGPLARRDARLYRLALLMHQRNLTSLPQLEAALRANGSSWQKQKMAYAEQALGQSHMREAIDADPEVTHGEMLRYYQENRREFQVRAKARWLQLTIQFSRTGSKKEAWDTIVALGNELRFGGTPFPALAKRSSHGSQAAEGGLHDWTERGDLEVSKQIESQVFSIKLNALSDIIEDGEGLHIVMVLERTPDFMIPFADAQVDIKKDLQNKKRAAAIQEYVDGLKERTPVWKFAEGSAPALR